MMTADDDLEQRLHNWFVDDARRMPQDVLEASIDSISSTGQVERRRWLRLLQGRPWPTIAAAAAIVLAVTGGSLLISRSGPGVVGPTGSPAVQGSWDPDAEFRIGPDQENPSPDGAGAPDVWSYLESGPDVHDPTAYRLLPSFDGGGPAPYGGPQRWYEPEVEFLFVGIEPGESAIALHPWTGTPQTARSAVLAWRSPASGTATIRGMVRMASIDCGPVTAAGIDFAIDAVSTTVFETHVPLAGRAGFQATTRVQPGDFVYFIVAAGSESNCDEAYLDARIGVR
jgi:hypothetical protein